jgi:Fe-S-cluster containining protein
LGIDRKLLKFHCTSCGNCCREPLLPLTDRDLRRLVQHTGQRPDALVRWVTAQQIDLDDEPEAFVDLRIGKRVMTLRHQRSGCLFLGPDQRCQIYEARPLGCRVFPFDSKFDRAGRLRRLELIQATECPYEETGKQRLPVIRAQQQQFLDDVDAYQAKIAAFNQLQRNRRKAGRSLFTSRDFYVFLGLVEPGNL